MNRKAQKLKEHTFVENYAQADARQQNHERNQIKRDKERKETMRRLNGDRGPNS